MAELAMAGIALGVAGFGYLILTGYLGSVLPAWVMLLAALAMLPKSLRIAAPQLEVHNGITHGAFTISTFGLTLTLALIIGCTPRATKALALFLPFLAYLLLGLLYTWPHPSLSTPGALHWATGILALTNGVALGRHATTHPTTRRTLVWVIATIIAAQFAVALLQLVGVPINPHSESSAEAVAGRVSGLLSHPNTLGKVLFLLLIFLLPMTRERCPKTAATAGATIMAAIALIGLTGGRATFAAAIAAILLWALAFPTRNLSQRLLLGAGATTVVALFADYFITRFQEDPEGGSRTHMTDVAWTLFRDHWLLGIGPNNYVAVGGPLDVYTASGFPVHNSFLLMLVEIGVIGVILALGPLIFLHALAAPTLFTRDDTFPTLSCQALLAALPGVLIIGLTGYGMAAHSVFVLWWFITGFLTASTLGPRRRRTRRRRPPTPHTHPAFPSTHPTHDWNSPLPAHLRPAHAAGPRDHTPPFDTPPLDGLPTAAHPRTVRPAGTLHRTTPPDTTWPHLPTWPDNAQPLGWQDDTRRTDNWQENRPGAVSDLASGVVPAGPGGLSATRTATSNQTDLTQAQPTTHPTDTYAETTQ